MESTPVRKKDTPRASFSPMRSDIDNVRKMVGLLGDEGFVEALTNAENLVNEANETLERVEKIEGEAGDAVREANEALNAVDNRLLKFDETISLLEAKIEAGFSLGFFFFALSMWRDGELLLAAGLAFMGLLGVSSLVVTIVNLPQVRRLRQVGDYATDRIDDVSDRNRRDEKRRRKSERSKRS